MNTNSLSWFPKALSTLVMLFLIGLFGSQTAGAAGVCYVNASASGANSGASWADAYTDLQSALGASPCTEVWVAAGMYKPTPDTDRAISFTLKNGVALYGGFAGTETDHSQRNLAVNLTTLTGDIGTPGDTTENSYHVVVGGGADGTAVLDGFTITGGNANGNYLTNADVGGGMYNLNSSPTLANMTFTVNSGRGGGMYNENSNPTLTDVIISGNFGNAFGSGMYNINSSSPVLTNVTFSGNASNGMFNGYSSPVLTHVTFSNNAYGGMYNQDSSPTLTDVIFSGNSATDGGGMYNGNSNLTLTNVTFSSNSAISSYGGGMYNQDSSATLTNVVFSDNSADGGGGIFNQDNSSLTLTNVAFINNSAVYGGGGLFNHVNPTIQTTLTNVTFSGNSAGNYGGGIHGGGHMVFTDVTFNNNSTGWRGGGMYNGSNSTMTNVTFNSNSAGSQGGGIYNSTSLTLTNATFSGNSASQGGGIYNDYNSSPQIKDSIFWDDSASTAGAEFYTPDNSNPNIADSVVAGGCPSGATCANILTTDPLLGPLANNGGFTQTMALGVGSSAIDAGNDATCASTDQRGVPRPQGAHCDMGAYELVNYQIYLPLVTR